MKPFTDLCIYKSLIVNIALASMQGRLPVNNNSSDVVHNRVGENGEGGVEENARAVLGKLSLGHLDQSSVLSTVSIKMRHQIFHHDLANSIHDDCVRLVCH